MSASRRARVKKLEKAAALKAARNTPSIFHHLLAMLLEESTIRDVPKKDRAIVSKLYDAMQQPAER